MIEGYENFAPIGHGGFSTVYVADQAIFDRRVAVKVLHTNLSDPDAQRRFVRECRATGRLTGHPHVVTVFDAGTTHDARPYLTMEYFPGGSLADRLKSAGPMDVRTVVATGIAVGGALDAAHRADILHRDLKPANILLRAPDHPVLSDFGIASIDVSSDAATASTAYTPGYAAPEILLGEEPSWASDVFALGATLFALLRGGPPYPGRLPTQVLARILDGDAEPLAREDVPADLADLLNQTLDRSPSSRPASAAEVVERLRALAATTDAPPVPVAAFPPAPAAEPEPAVPPAARPEPAVPPAAGPEPAATRRRRGRGRGRRSGWIPVAALVAIAAVIGSILLLRPDPDGTGPADRLAAGEPIALAGSGSDAAGENTDGMSGSKSHDGAALAPGTTPGLVPTPLPTAGQGAVVGPGGPGGGGGVGGSAPASAVTAPGVGGSAQPPASAPGATASAAAPPAPAPAPPANQAPPGPGCTARAQSVTDYRGRMHGTVYYCSTYVGQAVYANVDSNQAGEALDDTGWLNEAAEVWVICQLQGRANPVVQGNTNTWWLYTQADSSRSNTHGYSAAWGYLPATVVTVGGQNEPVPGVPTCGSYL